MSAQQRSRHVASLPNLPGDPFIGQELVLILFLQVSKQEHHEPACLHDRERTRASQQHINKPAGHRHNI